MKNGTDGINGSSNPTTPNPNAIMPSTSKGPRDSMR